MEYKTLIKDGILYVDVFGKLTKVIRAWTAVNGWFWYAFEESDRIPAEDSTTGKEEIIYFGLVKGFEQELGDFTLYELEDAIKQGLARELKGDDLKLAAI
jgi:hypothetical protein